MPDGSLRPTDSATEEVRRHLLQKAGEVKELDEQYLRHYACHHPVGGWQVTLLTDYAGRRRIDVVFDRAFPNSLPLVFLVDAPPPMTWPHVEKNRKLCIWPDGASLGGTPIPDVVDAALARACEVIDQGAAGTNREDLRDEALSYWGQAVSPGLPPFLSLLAPTPSTRRIAAIRGPQGFILADDENQLRRWAQNAYGDLGARLLPSPGILAWFDRPPLPNDYPRSVGGLLELLDRYAPTAAEAFRAALGLIPDHLLVVIGSPTKNGPCLMGVLVSRGRRSGIAVTKKGTAQINGFRSGKAPDPAPNVPSFISRIRSPYAPGWGGLQRLLG